MQLTAIENPSFALQPLTAGGRIALEADSFTKLLDEQPSPQNKEQAELREVAAQFVGMAFFMPMLSQARNSAFKTDLFHGGFAEDAFGNQMDQQLADEMAHRDATGLVESIMNRLGAPVGGRVDTRG